MATCQQAFDAGNLLEALRTGLQALDLIGHQHPATRAIALLALGQVQVPLGDYESALEHFHQAQRLYQTLQDVSGEAETVARIARLEINLGQTPQALELLESVIRQTHAEITPETQLRVYFEAAHAHALLSQEHPEQPEYSINCENYIEKALGISWQISNAALVFAMRNNIAALYGLIRRTETSEKMHRELLAEAVQLNDLRHQMSCQINLGHYALKRQDLETALQWTQAALEIAEQNSHREAALTCWDNLAQIYESQNKPQEALEAYKKFHLLERQIRSEKAERRTQMLATQLELEQIKNQHELQHLRSVELEQRVQSRTLELEQAQLEMLERLAIAAEYRDYDTGTHTQRVGECTGRIAKQLGLPEAEVQRLQLAARLHDIGKISIPDAILLNRDELTSTQWATIRAHTIVGAKMLEGSQSSLMRLAEEIALSHHERWDGTGYPLGLMGESIPLSGRITAVADVFDALLSQRPYKNAWTREAAILEIRHLAGTHFDPRVVAAFLASLGLD